MHYLSQFSMTLLASSFFCSSPLVSSAMTTDSSTNIQSMQPFTTKDFSGLLGMPGFSDKALNMHLQLYQGYVKNTNQLLAILNQLSLENKQNSPQFQELKRHFGQEYDGIRLHELYFSNLGGHKTKLEENHPLYKHIEKDFGSFDTWKKDFIETGMIRGIGWVVLYQEPIEGRLINTWIGEHDIGHLAGGKPVLIMDVWEHAYLTDYGINRREYITAFFDNIHWNTVAKRYKE